MAENSTEELPAHQRWMRAKFKPRSVIVKGGEEFVPSTDGDVPYSLQACRRRLDLLTPDERLTVLAELVAVYLTARR